MSYPHREFVIAWLDGQTVQYEDEKGEWINLDRPDRVRKMPHFYVDKQYRLAPVQRRVKVALLTNGKYQPVYTLLEERQLIDNRNFSRWLTSWRTE